MIIDCYKVNSYWQKSIAKYTKKIIVINDYIRKFFYCDILLDPTFNRKRNDYNNFLLKKTKLFLGHHYAILRKQFFNFCPQKLSAIKEACFEPKL